jgi:hypothetical protein
VFPSIPPRSSIGFSAPTKQDGPEKIRPQKPDSFKVSMPAISWERIQILRNGLQSLYTAGDGESNPDARQSSAWAIAYPAWAEAHNYLLE